MRAAFFILLLAIAMHAQTNTNRPRRITHPVIDRSQFPNVPTLAFDSESKEYDAKPGEMVVPFSFYVTNLWTNSIRVDQVHASCGCTTAKLPSPVPWTILPGDSGKISVEVNLAGKPPGMTTKTLTFFTTVGNRVLYLNVKVPPTDGSLLPLTPNERRAAMMKAQANARAIFQGDCANCHVEKGRKAMDEALYMADCGICHESTHRDKGVPDLHALKIPTNLGYWKTVIRFGKAHTTMPGFAASQGGPLTDAQVDSLAHYLDRTISHHFIDAVGP